MQQSFFRKKGLISKYKNRHLLLLGIPFLNRSIRFEYVYDMPKTRCKNDNKHTLTPRSICSNSGICTAWFLMLFRWVHHLLMRSFLPYAPKGSLPVVWGHELIMITSSRGAWLKSFFDTLNLFLRLFMFQRQKKKQRRKPKLWFCLEVIWETM